MKNLYAIILSLILAASAFAQDEYAPVQKTQRLGVGAKVTFDYGMIYGMDDEEEDVDGSPSGLGFTAGLMLRLQLVENFAFAPEFNFAYMKTEHEYLESTRRYTRMDLEIPLLLRGTVFDRFYVTFGPQLNLNLSNDLKADVAGMDIPEKFDQAFLDFGIAAGFGVNIAMNFYFDLRFYMGLTELFPDVDYLFGDGFTKDPTTSTGWSSIDMTGAKTMKIKAGFSYWFM